MGIAQHIPDNLLGIDVGFILGQPPNLDHSPLLPPNKPSPLRVGSLLVDGLFEQTAVLEV